MPFPFEAIGEDSARQHGPSSSRSWVKGEDLQLLICRAIFSTSNEMAQYTSKYMKPTQFLSGGLLHQTHIRHK